MLLEDLLSARKNTRNEQKDIEKKMKTETDDAKRDDLQTLYDVLEKRQLSYKVSANSGYGAMGVSRGYLPLMPGAMCVTAKGRESIQKVMRIITEQYQGKLVYGDTDSNYVTFEHLTDLEDLWKHAEKVSDEVSRNFPKPMKLEFEGFIYWRFLILTRKRYMSLKCKRDGVVGTKIEKKGVLLSRRDNSNFVRKVYSDIIMKIFDKEDKDKILHDTIEHINNLCSYGFGYKDFIITKSIGSVGDMTPQPIPGKTKKVKVGDYTVPLLPKSGPERAKQLELKKTMDDKEYYLRCLPAQVQLAEKMRRRGQRVDVGTRLEYLIVNHPLGEKAKQYEKIESSEYYANHVGSIQIDYMYYLKALANPLDQVLQCVFGADDLILKQYKQGIAKRKMLTQLKTVFEPLIIFE
jgi:DNA polymerase elongation subunit (family B)